MEQKPQQTQTTKAPANPTKKTQTTKAPANPTKKTQTSNPAMETKIQTEREKESHREFLAVPVAAAATALELTWSH